MRKVGIYLLLCLLLVVGCSTVSIKSDNKLDRPRIKLLDNISFTYEGTIDPAIAITWPMVEDGEFFDERDGRYYINTINSNKNVVGFCFVVMPTGGNELRYDNMFLKWFTYKANGKHEYYHIDKEGNFKLMKYF